MHGEICLAEPHAKAGEGETQRNGIRLVSAKTRGQVRARGTDDSLTFGSWKSTIGRLTYVVFRKPAHDSPMK